MHNPCSRFASLHICSYVLHLSLALRLNQMERFPDRALARPNCFIASLGIGRDRDALR